MIYRIIFLLLGFVILTASVVGLLLDYTLELEKVVSIIGIIVGSDIVHETINSIFRRCYHENVRNCD